MTDEAAKLARECAEAIAADVGLIGDSPLETHLTDVAKAIDPIIAKHLAAKDADIERLREAGDTLVKMIDANCSWLSLFNFIDVTLRAALQPQVD